MGWPVDSMTDAQRSSPTSTCLRNRVASGSGTMHEAAVPAADQGSVLPAMAAWTALRARFQQNTLSDGPAGTLRIW